MSFLEEPAIVGVSLPHAVPDDATMVLIYASIFSGWSEDIRQQEIEIFTYMSDSIRNILHLDHILSLVTA